MSDVDGLRAQIADALPFTNRDGCYAIADAVLPVVTAWAEQQARQRAAEELRAAASTLDSYGMRYAWPSELLNGRAAALADDGQP